MMSAGVIKSRCILYIFYTDRDKEGFQHYVALQKARVPPVTCLQGVGSETGACHIGFYGGYSCTYFEKLSMLRIQSYVYCLPDETSFYIPLEVKQYLLETSHYN
jgi:hypothetical protein